MKPPAAGRGEVALHGCPGRAAISGDHDAHEAGEDVDHRDLAALQEQRRALGCGRRVGGITTAATLARRGLGRRGRRRARLSDQPDPVHAENGPDVQQHHGEQHRIAPQRRDVVCASTHGGVGASPVAAAAVRASPPTTPGSCALASSMSSARRTPAASSGRPGGVNTRRA